MRTNIITTLLVFLSPILTSLSPLVFSLTALFILIIFNHITSTISEYKQCTKSKWYYRVICALTSRNVWMKTFKKLYEYAFAILTLGLFETYILGGYHIELLNGLITLTNATIIIISSLEVNEVFKNIENITGSNILEILKNLLPAKLKALFSR